MLDRFNVIDASNTEDNPRISSNKKMAEHHMNINIDETNENFILK